MRERREVCYNLFPFCTVHLDCLYNTCGNTIGLFLPIVSRADDSKSRHVCTVAAMLLINISKQYHVLH